MSAINSILRAATRKKDEPLNILTYPTHERWQSNLSLTGHNFYLIQGQGIKTWNPIYSPLPDNHVLLNPNLGEHQLPPDVDFDCIISQNKMAHFKISKQISDQLHINLVNIEHCLPHPSWGTDVIQQFKSMKGHRNIFISEFSRNSWGWNKDGAEIIVHGVDNEKFCPNDNLVEKKKHVLSVVNLFDSQERFWCCGFEFWKEAIKGLPYLHVGESKTNFSKPAKSIAELIMRYREAVVFCDTANASPVPSVLLEAMSCSCIVVTRANAMIPEIIKDNFNGFICETPEKMNKKLKEILANPDGYEDIRKNARQTIVDKFPLDKFVKSWDKILRDTANVAWTGE